MSNALCSLRRFMGLIFHDFPMKASIEFEDSPIAVFDCPRVITFDSHQLARYP